MQTNAQKEHEWLQQLVGEWTYEHEATMESGESYKATGTESVRSLGGLWIVAEGRGEMPGGGDATTILTLGYDPDTKRYVGTWIGSMMTYLWIYDGEMDAGGKVLTLNAEGPDMSTEGKMGNYRDVHEVLSKDHRTMTSYMLGDDGEWRQFVTAHYRRTA